MTPANQPAYRYQVGGTLRDQAPYVYRQADETLYHLLKDREFCYVFNSRQMGKSSLRAKTIRRLMADGIVCSTVDLTKIGTQVSTDQWYAELIGLLHSHLTVLLRTKQLANLSLFDLDRWQQQFEALKQETGVSPVRRFDRYLKELLLDHLPGDIVIFIDEIDHILALDFDASDFFAFIRACFNQRVDEPDYQRLTFALFGVATPSQLIRDVNKTPFNLGKDIVLTGLEFERSLILADGFRSTVSNPEAVLQEILAWTGGQPFLTQKLCALVQRGESQQPPLIPGTEATWVAELVRSHIINNWENQDQPQHLKTIRDRLLSNKQKTGRLLGLYQEILQKGAIDADNSEDHAELCLSGLVVRQEGLLKVYNRIYAAVFNQDWISEELAQLRPIFYTEALNRWLASDGQDCSCLLDEQALLDTLSWFMGKRMSHDDYIFLTACRDISRKRLEKRLAATEIRLQSTHSKKMFLTGQRFEALLEALRAGKKLRQLDTDAWMQENAYIQVVTILHQAIYGVNECNTFVHQSAVWCVSFSPDGQVLASGSLDGTVRLWNLNGQEIKVLKGHRSEVLSVCFSPDGNMLASGSWDGTVKLWSCNGQELQSFHTNHSKVSSVCFSPDGTMLAIGYQDGVIILQSLTNHKSQLLEKSGAEVFSICFSPDGKMIASASASVSASGNTDSAVKIWNINARKTQLIEMVEGHGYTVLSVSFSPDSQTIAYGNSNGVVTLLSLNGREGRTFKGHRGAVWNVIFSPDSQTIASCGQDGSIQLWSLNRQTSKVFKAHYSDTLSISFSPDSQMLASSSWDCTVKLWNIHGQKILKFHEHCRAVTSVCFSPDGRIIASASEDGTIKLLDLHGKVLHSFLAHHNVVSNVCFSPNGEFFASSSLDGTIRLWGLDGRLIKILEEQSSEVLSISFSPDGKKIASGGKDGIVIWCCQNYQKEVLLSTQEEICSVDFSTDGQKIASGSSCGTVRLWDLHGYKPRILEGHQSKVLSVTFSPDSKRLVSSGQDQTIRIWSLETQDVRILNGHYGVVSSLKFYQDGQALISGSWDGTVKFWDFEGHELETLENSSGKRIHSVGCSPDSKILVSGSDDGTLQLWHLDLDVLMKLGCDWVRDYLKHNPNALESDRAMCNLPPKSPSK